MKYFVTTLAAIPDIGKIATTVLPVVLGIAIVLILFSGYVKAAPDEAIIISGFRKKPKILRGRAGIKIPFLERKDTVTLKLIQVDVKTKSAVPTADYINLNVDANVNVKVDDNGDAMSKAAQNFLNKNTDYICKVVTEVLEGNMREIIGKTLLTELVSDRKKIAELVRENADPDLAAMGLCIVSFNIQNFSDDADVIKNLGVDNIMKIRKEAAISRAESEREIAKAEADAKRETENARIATELAVAEKQNNLEIRQAELKKEADLKRAESDASYRIEEEKQRSTIETSTINADIAKAERRIELETRQAEVQEKELDAKVRRVADADKYKREQEAQAKLIERQREADAQHYEQEKMAEARKSIAEAERYEKEQEALGKIKLGEAEAAAVRAMGEAEADAMMKKADAMKQYGDAAKMEMIINMLPEFAKAVAEPIAAIDKVTVIDSGNGESGVSSVGGYTPAVLAKVIESVRETTGFDLTEVMKADTYDAKVNKNLNVTGLTAKSGTTAAVSEDVHVVDSNGIPVHG